MPSSYILKEVVKLLPGKITTDDYSKLYNTWRAMKARCSNPNHVKYRYYGGRGIAIDWPWRRFKHFKAWALANGWQPGLMIDRIDNDGNYNARNCRFVTAIEQNNNRSNNVLLLYEGEVDTLANWARRRGIKYKTLASRIMRGWPAAEALTKEVYNGATEKVNS